MYVKSVLDFTTFVSFKVSKNRERTQSNFKSILLGCPSKIFTLTLKEDKLQNDMSKSMM